jgi:hypothetical protein
MKGWDVHKMHVKSSEDVQGSFEDQKVEEMSGKLYFEYRKKEGGKRRVYYLTAYGEDYMVDAEEDEEERGEEEEGVIYDEEGDASGIDSSSSSSSSSFANGYLDASVPLFSLGRRNKKNPRRNDPFYLFPELNEIIPSTRFTKKKSPKVDPDGKFLELCNLFIAEHFYCANRALWISNKTVVTPTHFDE